MTSPISQHTTTKKETRYACYIKDNGFIDVTDTSDPLVYDAFTDDITKTRTYATKQAAARDLKYKFYKYEKVKENLKFFRIEREIVVNDVVFEE